jgi:peptidoglycan-associated lipoprotein
MFSSFLSTSTKTLMICALALAVSCAKKPPQTSEEVGNAGGDTTQDSSISDQEMKFDPQGSDSGSIAGLKTVYFPYDSATLTSDGRSRLQGNADWLKKNSGYNLQIEGHTDSRGSIEYNLALGERRAKAVRAYLTNLGVSGNRLSIISYGEEKQIAQGDTEEAYSKNRRANFLPLAK